jgi:hypothetical protein
MRLTKVSGASNLSHLIGGGSECLGGEGQESGDDEELGHCNLSKGVTALMLSPGQYATPLYHFLAAQSQSVY